MHAARAPVAAAFSTFCQHFTQGDAVAASAWAYSLEGLAAHLRALAALMRHWEAVVPPERLLTVRYEELVARQEAVTRRVAEFAGLAWEDALLEFHRTPSSVATASVEQVRRPIYTSSLEGWRRYEEQLRPLVAMLEEGGDDPPLTSDTSAAVL